MTKTKATKWAFSAIASALNNSSKKRAMVQPKIVTQAANTASASE